MKVPDKCPFCQSSIMTHGGNPFRSEDCGFATYECKTSRDVSWQIDQFIRIGQSDVCRFREVILLTRQLDEANNHIKQLKNAGNNLANIIGPPHEITWATEIEIADAYDLWVKVNENNL